MWFCRANWYQLFFFVVTIVCITQVWTKDIYLDQLSDLLEHRLDYNEDQDPRDVGSRMSKYHGGHGSRDVEARELLIELLRHIGAERRNPISRNSQRRNQGNQTGAPFSNATSPTAAPFSNATSPTVAPFSNATSPTVAPFSNATSPTVAPFSNATSPTAAPFSNATSPTAAPFSNATSPTAAPFSNASSPTGAPFSNASSWTGAPFSNASSWTGAPFSNASSWTGAPFSNASSWTGAPFSNASSWTGAPFSNASSWTGAPNKNTHHVELKNMTIADGYAGERDCFEFSYILIRKLSEFPSLDTVSVGTNFNLHIPGLVDQALTTLRVIRIPGYVSKDLVKSLTEIILNDLSRCPSTKIHQGLMYGLSKVFQLYRKQHSTDICRANAFLKNMIPYFPMDTKDTIRMVNKELMDGLLQHIIESGYKELISDLEDLEEKLEEEFEETFIDRSEVVAIIENSLRNQTIACNKMDNLQNLFQSLNETLMTLSNGFPEDDVKEVLEKYLLPYLNEEQMDKMASVVANLSIGIFFDIQKVFLAFVTMNKDFLVKHEIVDAEQERELEEILRIIDRNNLGHQFNITNRRRRGLSRRNLLREILLSLIKRNVSYTETTTTQPQVSHQTEPSSTSSEGDWGKCKESSGCCYETSKATTKFPVQLERDVCFNFDMALNKVLGGFPDGDVSDERTVKIEAEDLEGLIQKSLTMLQLMGDPNLVAHELVFSISEIVLEKHKRCPSAMFGRAVYYLLARAFDNFEAEISEKIVNLENSLTNKTYIHNVWRIVDELNEFAIGTLLSKLRIFEYAGTKRRMMSLLRKVKRKLQKPTISTKALEKVLSLGEEGRWTWKCTNDVTVRKQLQTMKHTLSMHMKSIKHLVEWDLERSELPKDIHGTVGKAIQKITTHFLINVNELFKQILTKNETYLVHEKGLITVQQFYNFERIFLALEGSFLPSFVVPITESEIEQLVELQYALQYGASTMVNTVKQIIEERCRALEHVHIPNSSAAIVQTFFENCGKLAETSKPPQHYNK